ALAIYLLRTGGKLGLMSPIRTFPESRVVAGARTGGNTGLMSPIRTRPLSEMTAGISVIRTESFIFAIASSLMSSGQDCADATRGTRIGGFRQDKESLRKSINCSR